MSTAQIKNLNSNHSHYNEIYHHGLNKYCFSNENVGFHNSFSRQKSGSMNLSYKKQYNNK